MVVLFPFCLSTRFKLNSFLEAVCRVSSMFPLVTRCLQAVVVLCDHTLVALFFTSSSQKMNKNYAKYYTDFERPPFAPTFYPTEEEFADPITYVAKIKAEAEKYGVVKIKPPAVSICKTVLTGFRLFSVFC